MLGGVIRKGVRAADAPVDAVVRAARRGDVGVALIYHRVGRRSPSPVDLPLDQVRAQFDRIAASGAAGLDDLLEGRGRVTVTFDDGTSDWPDIVLPELVARSLPAVFYVATDFVERHRPFPDDGQPVSWAGLAEMVSTGLVTIGSHTHTHRVLADASAADAAAEIDRSVGLIEDRLGVPCRHFAYPKAVAPAAAAEVVVRRRFATAALAGNRANRPGKTDPYRIGRHGLTVADDTESFERKLGGGAYLEGFLRERRDAIRA